MPPAALSIFLASCLTAQSPDEAKPELMAWLDANGYATHNDPEIRQVNIPWDRAYYNPDEDVIYMSSRWQGTDAEKGLLLGELVHAQQDHPGDCVELETESHAATVKYLEKLGYELHKNEVKILVVKSCDPMNWAEVVRLKADR